MLSRMTLKSNTLPARRPLAQGCPGVRKPVDVELAEPLLLERLERAVLLVFPDLAVHVLEECSVALADEHPVVRPGTEAAEDLELVRTLLDEHLQWRPPLHDGIEPAGQQVLIRDRE